MIKILEKIVSQLENVPNDIESNNLSVEAQL